jgi:hypothetical protein
MEEKYRSSGPPVGHTHLDGTDPVDGHSVCRHSFFLPDRPREIGGSAFGPAFGDRGAMEDVGDRAFVVLDPDGSLGWLVFTDIGVVYFR